MRMGRKGIRYTVKRGCKPCFLGEKEEWTRKLVVWGFSFGRGVLRLGFEHGSNQLCILLLRDVASFLDDVANDVVLIDVAP